MNREVRNTAKKPNETTSNTELCTGGGKSDLSIDDFLGESFMFRNGNFTQLPLPFSLDNTATQLWPAKLSEVANQNLEADWLISTNEIVSMVSWTL